MAQDTVKRVIWFVLIFTIIFIPSQSRDVFAGVRLVPLEPPVVVPHDETGYASFIGMGQEGPLVLPEVEGIAAPELQAEALLNAYGGYFGLQNPTRDLELVEQTLSGRQNSFRYQQYYRGVPVMAGEIILNTDGFGGLQSMSGEASPNLTLDVEATVSSEEAVQTALGTVAKAQAIGVDSLTASEPELWIFDEQLLRPSDRPAELVWRMDVSSVTGAPINELVLVNAYSGGVSLHFNQIDTLWSELGQEEEAPVEVGGVEPVVEFTPELGVEAVEEEIAAPVFETVEPEITGTIYYVSTTGDDDLNDCLTPTTPCATIQAAVDKTVDGDGVYIAGGTYTGTGDVVAYVPTSISIVGGWDFDFTTQTEISIIDGEDIRRGILLNKENAHLDKIWVKNGYSAADGGGIWARIPIVISNTTVSDSYAEGDGGGIYLFSEVSTVLIQNAQIINSTISGNFSGGSGGGIKLDQNYIANVYLNNTTIVENVASADGGGVAANPGDWSLDADLNAYNSIIYHNQDLNTSGLATTYNTCYAIDLYYEGYNIVEVSGCAPRSSTTLADVGPLLGDLDPDLGIHLPYAGSPAIDGGNPSPDGNGPCLPTDQLGNGRPFDGDEDGESRCDIGAVEVVASPPEAPPRMPTMIEIVDGDDQIRRIGQPYWFPITVIVKDQFDYAYENGEVTFTAPGTGASAEFWDSGTNTTTAISGSDGIAVSSIPFANDLAGQYLIEASISGGIVTVEYQFENYASGTLYVSLSGDDGNDCLSPGTACATINGAISKASLRDVILVEKGTYTSMATEVVLVSSPVEISGGWSSDFLTQDGFSVIDGENVRVGVKAVTDFVILDHLWIKNSYSVSDGAGFYMNSPGNFYVTNSAITHNKADYGSAIYSDADDTIAVLLSNTTIARNINTAIYFFSIRESIEIRNCTIVENHSENNKTGGIYASGIQAKIVNSILYNNSDQNGEDNVYGNVISLGNNIFGDLGTYDYYLQTSDLVNVDPNLLNGIEEFGFYPLPKNSPAIDAGQICFENDIRGGARPYDGDGVSGAECDIGAFEYTGSATVPTYALTTITELVWLEMGTTETLPFSGYVLGENYGEVPGAEITFSAPVTDASGVFVDSGTFSTTVSTNDFGYADSPDFIPNYVEGVYYIEVSVSGGIISSYIPVRNWQTHIWYVSLTGDNANDCLSPTTPCITIDEPLSKPFFLDEDLIYVEIGVYTGTGNDVVIVDRDVTISGGWNSDFTAQTGNSTIDGENLRDAIHIEPALDTDILVVALDHLTVTGGPLYSRFTNLHANYIIANHVYNGPGIYAGNFEEAYLDHIIVTDVVGYDGDWDAGIVFSRGQFASITNSTIYDNSTSGIWLDRNDLIISNTTISGNDGGSTNGGGIITKSFDTGGTITLNNVTLYGNNGQYGAIKSFEKTIVFQNSIVAGNNDDSNGECYIESPYMVSNGNNIFGTLGDCIETPASGDLFEPDLYLLPLGDYGGDILTHALPGDSIAIDAGNPATPGSGGIACVENDQRGYTRPFDGDDNGTEVCDIGAFEYFGAGSEPRDIVYLEQPPYIVQGAVSTLPLRFYIVDNLGRGVPSVALTLTAPYAGPSLIFNNSGSNVITVVSDGYGRVNAGYFTANESPGSITITVENDHGLDAFVIGFNNIPIIETYTMNNDNNRDNLPGTFLCDYSVPMCTSGSDLHADYAHQNAFGTVMFYLDWHNRISIDGAGMAVISSAHFDSGYNNAFWDGNQMVYGDGKEYPLADDVVGHELTHGVTDYESNLFYYYQSGAINESFSDLWGEFFDLLNPGTYDDASYRWYMGETIGAIRYMANPTAYSDPDKMTSSYYYLGNGDYYYNDNGGVHTNSGVNNKAVYLMTDGGTFNGYTITGIGMQKVAAIYYEVQTNLLTSGADYKDLYYAVQQACQNLIGGSAGITAADCVEVTKALNAVEMSLDPVSNYNPDPEACPAGYVTQDIFYDGFETGTSNWTIYNNATIGETWGRITGTAAKGFYSMFGPDFQGVDAGSTKLVTYIQNTSNIAIPAGTVYFHFEHMFGFEDPNYDGGLLQYSVNGGGWKDINALLVEGQGYTGTISNAYGNQYGGQSAFVGDSHGYVSSKYNLSAFSGKNLRFRWIVSSDEAYYDIGWILDEVRVYQCEEIVYGVFVAPEENGYILQPRAWLIFEPTELVGEVTRVKFLARYNDGSGLNWHYIGDDTDGSDGWDYQWATASLPEEAIRLQAVVYNSEGEQFSIFLDNVTPTDTIVFGNGYELRGGGSWSDSPGSEDVAVPESICPVELETSNPGLPDEIFIYTDLEAVKTQN